MEKGIVKEYDHVQKTGIITMGVWACYFEAKDIRGAHSPHDVYPGAEVGVVSENGRLQSVVVTPRLSEVRLSLDKTMFNRLLDGYLTFMAVSNQHLDNFRFGTKIIFGCGDLELSAYCGDVHTVGKDSCVSLLNNRPNPAEDISRNKG